MNINITTKLQSITQETKDYATEKAKKLEKFKLRKIEIIMEMEGEKYSVQMVASPERSGNSVVGSTVAGEWLSAIDGASDKVERQLKKAKDKVKSHRMKKVKESGRKDGGERDEETYDDVVNK